VAGVGASAVFCDTTVLLGGLIEFEEDAPAQRILDAIASGRLRRPFTAWHCCLEFFAVSTRLPPEFRLTPADAVRLIDTEVIARFDVRALPDREQRGFWRSAAAERLVGGRIYDAHIADIARAAGCGIVVTDNRRHFTTLLRHQIRVLTTDEFAAESKLA
jgi:predicted nucleic acid-binding protein